jgi:hypothetical protein
MRFAWMPEHAYASHDTPHSARAGWAFLARTATAPLIEILRSDLPTQRDGRLYWADVPVTAAGAHSDGAAFARWYRQIVSWVQLHGRPRRTGAATTYVLPDAARRMA